MAIFLIDCTLIVAFGFAAAKVLRIQAVKGLSNNYLMVTILWHIFSELIDQDACLYIRCYHKLLYVPFRLNMYFEA